MTVNFLHVNSRNYAHWLLAVAIIVSKRLVSMGRKSCLFMYYVELVDIKLWMVEEARALNGGLAE
jgi:hypothetical protein